MAKQDFIPDADADFVTWLNNFHTQLAIQADSFGIPEDEVTDISNRKTSLGNLVNAANAARAAAQTASQNKAQTRRQAEAAVRSIARRIKAHPAYTEVFGTQMGIEGPEDSTDLSESKPTLTVDDRARHHVVITFNKSISDGVNIYSKRGSETQFTFLARDTESPYMDTRPCSTTTPETREYYALYVLHDEEIGQPSDTVQATCQP